MRKAILIGIVFGEVAIVGACLFLGRADLAIAHGLMTIVASIWAIHED
jgi:hypothetical protein